MQDSPQVQVTIGGILHGLIKQYRHQKKMPTSKTIYLLRDIAAGDYMSDTPPPPLHTVQCIRRCTYSYREGGRGESLTREKVRGAAVHNAGSKIPT
jgi:hypothetical protein